MDQVFGVDEDREAGRTVVTVSGEVDVATAPALRECLDRVVGLDEGAVVVDLRGVTFIDSTGLGVLIGAHRASSDAGRELRLVLAEPRILKVFEITGLTDLFAIDGSLEEATTDPGEAR